MNLLYTTDQHNMIKQPPCRTDDFPEAIIKTQAFIKRIIRKYSAIHVDGGDLLDVSNPGDRTELNNFLMKHLDAGLWTILGNHDLKENNILNYDGSQISNLVSAGVVNLLTDEGIEFDDTIIYGYHYGTKPAHVKKHPTKTQVMVWHKYISNNKVGKIKGVYMKDLMTEFPEYDIFLTGDNHVPFSHTQGNQLLINGGSLHRFKADQEEYKPHIYIIDTETKEVKSIPVPIGNDIFSREHIEIEKKRKLDLENFGEGLKKATTVTVNFETTMEDVIKENKDGKITNNVEHIIKSYFPKEK